MRKTGFILLPLLAIQAGVMAQGNVGIKTSSPKASLHIGSGNLLISGPSYVGNTIIPLPDATAGTKFMWISDRAALRAGRVLGDEWNPDSLGAYSLAFGTNVSAPGYASAAFGAGNRVGYYAFSAGYENTALADNATAFGAYNTVTGRGGSFVAGEFNIVKSYGTTVVGRFNDTTNMTSPINLGSYNPLFVVGIGTSQNARANALTVMNNGQIGIGTPSPAGRLHIRSNSSISDPQLLLEETQSEYARIKLKNATGAFWDLAGQATTTGSTTFFNLFYHNGTAGNDKLSLSGLGNLWIAGTLSQSSDARLKTNIIPLEKSLDKLVRLHGYHYTWKDTARDQRLQTGLLAQEVEQVFPELVSTDNKGVKSVNYIGMIPYLLAAIQEQQTLIKQLMSKPDQP